MYIAYTGEHEHNDDNGSSANSRSSLSIDGFPSPPTFPGEIKSQCEIGGSRIDTVFGRGEVPGIGDQYSKDVTPSPKLHPPRQS